MPAPPASFTDPVALAVVIAAGLFAIGAGLTMFYGIPRGSARIAQRQSYIIWHQVRAGTNVGPRRFWPATVPLGIFCLLLGLGGPLVAAGWPWLLVGVFSFLLAMVALAFAFVMAFRPPKRFLPRWWVVEEERRRAGLEPLIPPPSQGREPTMTRRHRRLAVLFLVGLVVIGFVFRLPASFIVAGVAAGSVYLVAVRVREEPQKPA